MESKTFRPAKHRKGVITIECNLVANFGERFFEVLISIPGHDGIAEASWPLTNGACEADQVSDMIGYIGSCVTGALWGSYGAQEVLPFD